MIASRQFGSFTLDQRADGVAILTFSRPPVNAVSLSVYEDIGRFSDFIAGNDDICAIVLTAPEGARAWCGGADLHDFKGMTEARRKERYGYINAQLPRFHDIDRPVIAAIRGATIGIGVMLAALCDLRVASEDARFACPEVDYGLIAGSAGLLATLGMPQAKLREIYYTGRAFTARELEPTGFFNYVLPRAAVLPMALDLAGAIAAKRLPVLRQRKRASLALEGSGWIDSYLEAQAMSASLVENPENEAAVRAALDRGRRR